MLTTCANAGREASNIKGGSAATRHAEDAVLKLLWNGEVVLRY